MYLVETVDHVYVQMCGNLFKDLRVVLKLDEIIEVTASFRLVAEMV